MFKLKTFGAASESACLSPWSVWFLVSLGSWLCLSLALLCIGRCGAYARSWGRKRDETAQDGTPARRTRTRSSSPGSAGSAASPSCDETPEQDRRVPGHPAFVLGPSGRPRPKVGAEGQRAPSGPRTRSSTPPASGTRPYMPASGAGSWSACNCPRPPLPSCPYHTEEQRSKRQGGTRYRFSGELHQLGEDGSAGPRSQGPAGSSA